MENGIPSPQNGRETEPDHDTQQFDVAAFKKELNGHMQKRDWEAMTSTIDTLLSSLDTIDSIDTLEDLYKIAKTQKILASEFAPSEDPTANTQTEEFATFQKKTEIFVQKLFEQKNRKTIEVAGENILRAWQIATRNNPELQTIEVKQSTPEMHPALHHTAGFFRKPGAFGGEPTVFTTADAPNEHFSNLRTSRKRSVEIIAALIGENPETISAEKLKTFIFLHELGHAHDFLSMESNTDRRKAVAAWEAQYTSEMGTLPIPGVNPSILRLSIENGELDSILSQTTDPRITSDMTPEDIIAIQDAAYRALPKETYADSFAANLMHNYPEL